MNEPTTPQYPFAEQPVFSTGTREEGVFTSILEFKNNPDWIVKEVDMVNDEIMFEWRLRQQSRIDNNEEIENDPVLTFDRFRAEVAAHKKILETSQTDINKFIPPNHLVFGENSYGNTKGFIVMQRVIGEDVSSMRNLTSNMLESLEELLLASLDFYDEQLSMGSGLMPDLWKPDDPTDRGSFRLSNLMFGKIKDGEEQVFLVDTYPLICAGGANSAFFDNFKRALESFYEQYRVLPSAKLRDRLVQYGNTAFEVE